MKHLFILLLCSITVNTVTAQDSIVIGTKHKLFSAVLKEERSFWVYLPPSYTSPVYQPAKYPVVYLLDAESNFHSFTGIVQSLSKGPYAMIPEMIVVGITNTDRTRDLTPTVANNQAFFSNRKIVANGTGGNKNFIFFLVNELRPVIDSVYRTSGYNILNGHSFGGLTAVNTLLNNTSYFNAYNIIDPSLWWDDMIMLKQADSILSTKDFAHTNIFVAHANKENIPQDTTTDMQRGINGFHQQLQTKSALNLHWQFKFYKDEDHGTVPIPAAYDGLRYIFFNHLVHVKQAVEDTLLVERQYQQLSRKAGFTFHPSEVYLDWMGNYCMSLKKHAAALHFYTQACRYYTQSGHAYLAAGKVYLQVSNKRLAEIYLKQASRFSISREEANKLLLELNK